MRIKMLKETFTVCKVVFLVCAVASGAGSARAETLSFSGETEKNPLLYKVGEEIIFNVTLVDKAAKNAPVKGRRLAWTRTGDDGKTEKGEAVSDGPLAIRTRIDKPGFVRVIVNVLGDNGKPLPGAFEKFDGSAGADVNDMFKMVMRDVRAVAFAKTRPEWDGKTLTVGGGSMGGYRSIALAALDRDVTSCAPHYAWMTDLVGHTNFNRIEGWLPKWTPEMAYVDGANLATRVTCPVSMLIGLSDYVCPPSGEMILFRNCKGPKSIRALQNAGHGIYYGVTCPEVSFNDAIR